MNIQASPPKSTWFIADLHLSPERPELTALFYAFIDDIKDSAETLYILGDLFEFWIGDDVLDYPIGKDYKCIVEKLSALSLSGTTIYLITGNRDFLLSKKFYTDTGITPLPDYYIIQLYGKKVLICHGDTLCTDDKGYQLLRKLFRLRWVQKLYLSLSLNNRNQRAKKIRRYTSKIRDNKQHDILDVNQQTVNKVMTQYDVQLLIHGHTHRPAEHQFKLASEKKATRLVLGDWHHKASYIQVSSDSTIKCDSGR